MIDAVTFDTAHLFGPVLPSMHRLRYRSFVERQSYEVPNARGMEWDQFDTPLAVYLVWRDERGEVRGSSRLLPTTSPYMLKDLWPQLVEDGPLPADARIWELTRSCVDRTIDARQRHRVYGELVCSWYEYALDAGIDAYLTLTAPGILHSTFGGAGCTVKLLGQRQRLPGTHPVVAARIEVSEQELERARRFYGITGPVLRYADELEAWAA